MSKEAEAWLTAGGIILLFAITIVIVRTYRKKITTARTVYTEIARIEGTSDLTPGGAIAVILMVVFNVGAFFTYYTATTILQQTVAALSGISASVFWGVFALLGRKQTYRVLRDDSPSDLNIEPRA